MITHKKQIIFLSLLLTYCASYAGDRRERLHERHKERSYTQHITATRYRWAERIILAGICCYFTAYNIKKDIIQLLQSPHSKELIIEHLKNGTPLPLHCCG